MPGGGDNDQANGEKPQPLAVESGRGADAGCLPFGTVLGKYRVVDLIGRGGMGIVYRAEHVDLGMLRALKTLAPEWVDHPLAQARFLKEARAAARISHPHVVKIFDSGSHDGLPFFVMEYLEGEDLASALTRTRLNVEQTAGIMLAICAAISELHEQGLIHRDLKPGNIFLARDKVGNIVPTVLDFGIVKPVGAGPSSLAGQTQDGDLVGTVHYISPEQLSDFPAGERSDQYALGVILYQSVTGRRPFEGGSAIEVLGGVARFQFPRPSALCPDLPLAFEKVVLTAMSERPADRYPSVYLLGKALFPFASPKHQSLWADYYDRLSSPKEALTAPIAVAASSTWLPRPERVFVTQPLSYGAGPRPRVSAHAETTPMSRSVRIQPLSSAGSERSATPAVVNAQPPESAGTQPLPGRVVSTSHAIAEGGANAQPASRSEFDGWNTSGGLDRVARDRGARFWLSALAVVMISVALVAFWSRSKQAPGTGAIENAIPVPPAPTSTSAKTLLRPVKAVAAVATAPAPSINVTPATPAVTSVGVPRPAPAQPGEPHAVHPPPLPPAASPAGLVPVVPSVAVAPAAGATDVARRASNLRGDRKLARPGEHKHARSRNQRKSPTAATQGPMIERWPAAEKRPATVPPSVESGSKYPAVGRTSDSQYPAME